MSGNAEHKKENSRSPARSGNGDLIEANRVIDGVAREEKEYAFSAVAPSDKPGSTVGTHVRKGGELHVVMKGGTELIGGTAEDRERLARIQAEVQKEKIAAEAANKVQVAVMFSDDSERYRGSFDRSDELYDVRAAIKKSGKQVLHFKYFDLQEELDIRTPVSGLKGDLVAVVNEENVDLR